MTLNIVSTKFLLGKAPNGAHCAFICRQLNYLLTRVPVCRCRFGPHHTLDDLPDRSRCNKVNSV